ncbi:MAG: porin family protein, partial [Xanthobacteraceae bacterium]
MRSVMICLAVLGCVDAAVAADLDDSFIRGSDAFQPQSPSYPRWSGFYAGGQLGYATSHMDFTNAAEPLLSFALRNLDFLSAGVQNTPVFGTQDTQSSSYGAFFGYNSQWEQVVLGVELNYNRTSLTGSQSTTPSSPAPFVVTPGDGNTYGTIITASALTHITDYGTLHARAGYIIGNFLPYATVGLAAGRADINDSATVSFVCINGGTAGCPKVGYTFGYSQSQILSKWLYGYSVGLGLEAAV